MTAPATPTAASAGANIRLGYFLLVGLTLGWGLNWPFMKTALLEIPPWQFRAVTIGIGAAAFLIFARAARMPLAVPRRHWPILVGVALLNITSWHILISYGVLLMESGHAAIIAFTMPVWAALLGATFLRERPSPRVIVALVCGAASVLVLVWGDLGKINASPLGAAIVIIAAINWAIGTVVQKRVRWTVTSVPLAGWQLLIGVIPIIIVSIATERFVWHEASTDALLSALYLTTVAMMFCYYAWFRIVTIFPANVAAIGTLMIPVVGLFSSALILGETVGWQELVALALVVAAMGLVLIRPEHARAPLPSDAAGDPPATR